ncbi:MAG TPA: hypothetical protein VK489_05580 [Ferruginibacter sp.]|nr:hypothetical protein [Ferruginibacter sp.]
MRTEESLLEEFQILAGNILAEYKLKYHRALKKDPALSPNDFLSSVSKEFREKLAGTATNMLQKLIEPDLDLVFSFKKINTESAESFKAAILNGDARSSSSVAN